MMPPDALKTLSSHDAILLGAVGRPDVPDHISLRGLLREKTGLTPDVGGTASTPNAATPPRASLVTPET